MIALLLPIACWADVYVHVDANGNTYYSDTPTTQKAKPVALPPLSVTYSSQSKAPAQTTTEPKVETQSISQPETEKQNGTPEESAPAESTPTLSTSATYKTFAISSPTAEQTFQNQRDITVTLTTDPELQSGDKIQILIDNTKFGAPQASTSFNFYNLDRGSHTFRAILYNANNEEIKQSNSVTIYIHYAHVGELFIKELTKLINATST